MREIEKDGFITREEDLMMSERTAKPVTECEYPKCDGCDKYVDGYCTVPMVVNKQIYRFTAERIAQLEKSVTELEKLVMDEILGEGIDHEGYHKQVVGGDECWCPNGCHIEVHDGLKYFVINEEDK